MIGAKEPNDAAPQRTSHPDAVLDQLLAGADPKTVFEPNGLLDDLKKALAERVLNAEMDHHLAGEEPGNRRNGYGKKTVITDTGRIEMEVPRDRQARFDPQLIAKYQRRFPGFDDEIISMYARGMSTREIVGHLRDLYGIEVSPDLISAVTDAVLEEVAAWQARPLEAVYPLIFFDALRVTIRDEGLARNKAVHIALGVRADGTKEILGLWLEQNEGAKFWLRVMNELKNRGVEDVLIAVIDGLKDFPDAITAVFPQATVQTCVVHLLRHSLDFVSWKDRKPVAAALKDIYRAVDATAGEAALTAFEDGPWGNKYPAISQSWRRRQPRAARRNPRVSADCSAKRTEDSNNFIVSVERTPEPKSRKFLCASRSPAPPPGPCAAGMDLLTQIRRLPRPLLRSARPRLVHIPQRQADDPL
jgi:putative transposase